MQNRHLSLAIIVASAYAIRVPIETRFSSPPLTRRIPSPISNTGNAQYVSNITLGGVTLPVLLDTGSSDLWAAFPGSQPSLTTLGDSVSLNYAVGKVNGDVAVTTLQFGNYTVDNQAFLYVSDTSTFTADIRSQGYYGLLGLGPNSGSVVRKKISKDSRGNTMLTHIFETDNLTDNYISFLLDRKGVPNPPFQGQITISELVPGFENVSSMPQIDIDKVNRLLKADQHWQILTDKDDGIIGPDGQPLKVDSIVPGCPDGQLVAVIDSGFTFSQVPRDISDQIYGRVQGAYYDTNQEFWMIPCQQSLNLTFNFGGQSYFVHPLDTVDNNFNQVDSMGQPICLGAFQPITSAFSLLGHYDMILGMSFLRNAYTLLNLGNWIDISSEQQAHPYVQLLSVTNPATAHSDFVKVRLGGVDTTGDPEYALLSVDQMQHSPVSAEEKKKKYQEMILSRWPYILLGCLVFTLGLTGYCVWRCCCRKNRKQSDRRFTLFFRRNRKGDDVTGSHNHGGEEMSTGYGVNSVHKRDQTSSYYRLADSNNSTYAFQPNHLQHSQPHQFTSPSQNNLHPDGSFTAPAQNWDNGSMHSLPGAGGQTASTYVLNPYASESVASVHLQRQQPDYGGIRNEDSGAYAR